MKKRVLQVGVGNYGKFHRQVWRDLDVDLVTVDPQVPQATYKSLGVIKDLSPFDIIDVVTSAESHLTVMAAVSSAMHENSMVFCEKPLGLSAHSIRWFQEHYPEVWKRTFVGMGYRFIPELRWLKRGLGEQENYQIHVDFYAEKRARKDSTLLWADGIHAVDLILYLRGAYEPLPSAILASLNPSWEFMVGDSDSRVLSGLSLNTSDSFLVSNALRGIHPDPVIEGAFTTKRVVVLTDGKVHTEDFSRVKPREMLMPMFAQLLSGIPGGLATAEQALRLTEILEEME